MEIFKNRKIIVLVLIIAAVYFSSFSPNQTNLEFSLYNSNEALTVPNEDEVSTHNYTVPFIGKTFNGFRDAVAFKESRGKYQVVNTKGYLGKYQFGKSTLRIFDIHNSNIFLKTPELQEDAFVALCALNKYVLKDEIKEHVGTKINGIEITESGILAAAHLAGATNVKKYLRSGGSNRFRDAYGTSLRNYIKKFSGYDTSFIKASKNPEL
ncbi:hypothetical protein [Lutibacter sp.]|uniref:hypothetical protein n=1 Tax=Lutibacter sp. TaxID=1925666 RepID=UPI00273299DD|nr:hypothetical protein [Lutibacter sp.]MDP3312976.1 hypothetical protein [Lutibacter sp.]